MKHHTDRKANRNSFLLLWNVLKRGNVFVCFNDKMIAIELNNFKQFYKM